MSARAPLALRCLRLARLAGYLASALTIAALRYRRMDAASQRTLLRWWSRRTLTVLGVTVRASGLPAAPQEALPARCLLVGNHISWMDILVLLSVCPAVFVAKADIRSWPLVGWLCAAVGTLFIERGRRRSARRISASMTDALARGQRVCIFPEGVTTDGHAIAHFHSALLQPAIDAGALIQPLALRYRNRGGGYCAAPVYVGDTSFMASLWTTTGAKRIFAELEFLAPIAVDGRDRRALARASEAAIAAALGAPIPSAILARGRRSPPGTAGGPPAGSP